MFFPIFTGLSNAVEEAVAMGGKAFGLFVRSQRTWDSKPMTLDAAENFKAACKVRFRE
jgi:AP endonuclease-1